ncbi:type II secretion system F family protein [Jannaschia faecimaris]|nr:type II secretion system F family protein [Jannaschia faecimaris]
MESVNEFLTNAGAPFGSQVFLQAIVAAGLFITVMGIAAALRPAVSSKQRRIQAIASPVSNSQIVRPWDNDPTGALRLFVPLSGTERSRVSARLRQAGIHGAKALRTFFVVRSILALLLPGCFLLASWFSHTLPPKISEVLEPMSRLETQHIFLISIGLIVLGFYSPSAWLQMKVAKRRKAVTRGLPGALDLMQVAIEAGLGFDAAMNRVAKEFGRFCGPIAEEFTILQLEIQAGKPRDLAFAELERRTGVDVMASFANVVQQSAEFGTPISQALENYAIEMRQDRELKAQAKANALPVKMSGVLAAFMMPILLLIMLTPIAIRWTTVLTVQ